MKTKLPLYLLCAVLITACKDKAEKEETRYSTVELAAMQYDNAYNNVVAHVNNKRFMPRTTKNDTLRYVGAYDWTSGFYPGTLWNLYALTKDEKWKERAVLYTEKLDTIQYWEDNHDVGFMIECSYGSGLKYMNSFEYDSVIVRTAKSLSTRFKPNAGVIQSWEWNKKWECPVIIDNMMNLELLFHATRITGDSVYYKIATSHADTTIKNHFREDNSSYHVVDYNKETGEVIQKNTHQGLSDDSAWSRGQAWGLYGYTLCYRETKDDKYLDQAVKIAEFIKNHPNLPADKVPYWDYNAPAADDTPRDASAAAIAASALYELSQYVDDAKKEDYVSFANAIVESLSSPKYLAETGTNAGFILKHSVGSKPHDVEVDVPLNYADYYFLEALIRQEKIK
ncbi:glycoside hydrolase family 88 protein [Zhouia spongiae]|uniref:Glycoside hydrolase family 88 protein n=1 Tax=Zhouia spongiae TaxID=2202721 RepID=A0ABY3YIL9_9FLAO|nr:glycoside hydrolase family 88 protein [Zhouia spongiae]UNY97472.1 glycoside hydrolase family 88 protein [Zhouia spongiae]